ncbi:hypothetical protein EVJ32_05165 [Exiguobacterium sp. SH5S4]|uniref:hypothetical protein n=1 Tax=Exiguobacterium sp. SH5S4 TaxID=2510961 RepID=UPI00103E699A|nr:hypothetical protein [Exiguobacterium sp. SH5S4]TCI26768.1 hypothetical protein EVJ32_05165 [Exiguobacterium sp. SH5S4]
MSNHTFIKKDKELFKALEPIWYNAIINRDAWRYIITEAMVNNIEELVYERYNPTLYRRRFDGMGVGGSYGLAHKQSQVVDFHKGSIRITNSATGQNYDKFTRTYEPSNVRLLPIIESGEGYSWKKSQIARSKLARPFTPSVMAQLQKTMPQAITSNKLNNTDNKVVRDDYLPF